MWPWEHAIVGYFVYSSFCHLYYREPPGGPEALAVVVASQVPDLVDKPLAWSFEIVETGYALGHSAFFVVPLVVGVGLVASTTGRSRLGVAFAVGYLLHPPADVLTGYATGGSIDLSILLWPLLEYVAEGTTQGVLSETLTRIDGFWHQLLSGELTLYMELQLVLAALTFLLWIYDGTPVLRESLAGSKAFVVGALDR